MSFTYRPGAGLRLRVAKGLAGTRYVSGLEPTGGKRTPTV